MEHNDRIREDIRSTSNIPEPQENLNTREVAACFRVEAATVRRAYCVNGHYLGLKPVKLSNQRLLWPRAEVIRVLGGER